MSNPVIFKTSAFGGFQKAAVLSYIDQMNADSQKLKEELDGKIAALEARVSELKGQLPSEEEKAAAVEREEAQQKKSREMEELINQLNQEMARQQKLLSDKDEEIKQMNERTRKLQFQAESHSFKAKKYDEIAMKIGSLVIDAKQQAESHGGEGKRRGARRDPGKRGAAGKNERGFFAVQTKCRADAQ